MRFILIAAFVLVAGLLAVAVTVSACDAGQFVGRLAGGVAHETNNQMTVVLGAASFLLKHKDLPPAVHETFSRSDGRRNERRASAASSSPTAGDRCYVRRS